MHVLIAHQCVLPVKLYGGTERVLWALGKELSKRGHKVTFLLQAGSKSNFADVIFLDGSGKVSHLIPEDVDVVHLNFRPLDLVELSKPYIMNMQGNTNEEMDLDENTIFVSRNHASRYGSKCFIYNGMDWDEYSAPDLKIKRNYFHFLAKAAWKVKNVKGAVEVIKKSRTERLVVMGGVRFNFKMGVRLTFSPKVKFHGMVGGALKDRITNGSKGLLFPVRWHEPFGIAITESLFYGCPVFGTPYGSLSELIHKEVGYLSDSSDELSQALLNSESYSSKICHEYARDMHNSALMTTEYIKKYELVMKGEKLNDKPPRLLKVQNESLLPWK